MSSTRFLRTGLVLGSLILSAPLDAIAAVGRTPTSYAVSSTGESQYTVPLVVPPGTAGLAPKLSLVYSHGGDGVLLGVGWSISGLESISRCPKTWVQDGSARAVALDAMDRYCLNGTQLKLYSGTYGQPNSEYRTELETYSRIAAYDSAGAGPAWFQVERADGLIYRYGSNADSRIEALGKSTARAWMLDQVRDRNGNQINYSYNEDTTNGGVQVASVSYTANPSQGINAATVISFTYETQPSGESQTIYRGGSKIKDIKRMTRIDVSDGGALVRRYNIAYETTLSSANRSRLSSVTECVGVAGDDCRAATAFTYQNATTGVGAFVASSTAEAAVFPIDYNGDARVDLVYSSGGTFWIARANGSGYDAAVNTGIASTTTQVIPIDSNADGKEDLLISNGTGTWWTVRGSADGLLPAVNTGVPTVTFPVRALDTNGDGLDDLVWVNTSSKQVIQRFRTSSGWGAPSVLYQSPGGPAGIQFDYPFAVGEFRQRTRRPDFNGDGKDDLLFRTRQNAGGTELIIWQPINSNSNNIPSLITTPASVTSMLTPDINGDGCSDLAYVRDGYWYFRLSGCGMFTIEIATGVPIGSRSYTSAVVMDWNGDGKEDILVGNPSTSRWDVLMSTGEGFFSNYLAGGVNTAVAVQGAYVGDANGNGEVDLIVRQGTGLNWGYLPRSGLRADLLKVATDGYGNTVTFTYSPLSNFSGYTVGSGSVFPTQEFIGPLYVVSNVQASDGVGGTFTLNSFKYEAARLNLEGRGFLGFARRSWIDSRTGIGTSITYRQDYPFIGNVSEERQSQEPSGTTVVRKQTGFASFSLGSDYEARALPYVNAETLSAYELGGSYNGTLVRTVQTSNLYDSATGALYDRTVTTTEPASGANGIRSGVTWSERIYTPTGTLTSDTASWCLGRPGEVQRIQSHSSYGGVPSIRTSQVAWDTTKCRPSSIVSEPFDNLWRVTTALSYDSFGNLTSQSVTGAGMTARMNSASFGPTGRFPVSQTNPLSQSSTTTWDSALGLPLSQTDANSLTTAWLYDGFARKTRETRPDGTYTTWDYENCTAVWSGCSGGNNRTVVTEKHWSSVGTLITEKFTYRDRFDRPLVEGTRNAQGVLMRTERNYNAMGEVWMQSAPCTWSGCSSFWTTSSYDALGRLTQSSRPISDSNSTLQYENTYYEGLTTRIVDSLGKQSTQILDATGRPAQQIDHSGYGTTFDYDAFGNAIRVQDTLGNTLQAATFNVNGARLSLTDMDMGYHIFVPNALGEVEYHTDANGLTRSFMYDALGRLIQRTEVEGTTNWTWGTSAHNSVAAKYIGALKSVSGPGYSEFYTRDALGRLSSTAIMADTSYHIDVSYNSQGLRDTLTYPTSTSGYRLKLQYEYGYGQLQRVRDFNALGTIFWELGAMNARGQVTQETLGLGILASPLVTNRSFDAVTGQLKTIQTGPGGGTGVQHLSYSWDQAGNLSQRQDLNQSVNETFVYDNLHRLDYSQRNGTTNLDLAYDTMGNITSRTGVGTYTYHATRKHQLTSTSNGWGFTYDSNGNQLTGRGQSITWYSYNLPNSMTASGVSSQFWYTPGRQYWKQADTYVDGSSTTIYVGGILEKVTKGGVVQYRHMIPTGNSTVIVSRNSSGGNTAYFVTRDHLGSSSAIVDTTGTTIADLSYGAFGDRRGSNWLGSPSAGEWAQIAATTRRGYTNHSMLDNLLLIHMNGRVQDSATGRFISVDPHLDSGVGTQAWNRYGYTGNRLLNVTDPTGFVVLDTWSGCSFYCQSVSSRWISSNRPGTVGAISMDHVIFRMGGETLDQCLEFRSRISCYGHPFAFEGGQGTLEEVVIVGTRRIDDGYVYADPYDRDFWFGSADGPNACGSGGLNVPNSVFGYNINGACESHDACYSYSGKFGCDTAFFWDISEIIFSQSTVKDYLNLRAVGGHAVAHLYFVGVLIGGGPAYQRSE